MGNVKTRIFHSSYMQNRLSVIFYTNLTDYILNNELSAFFGKENNLYIVNIKVWSCVPSYETQNISVVT